MKRRFTRRAAALAAVAAAFLGASARADCSSEGIQFFPAPGSVVPTNSRFILEGLGSEQKKVSALVGDKVIFRAKDDAVTAKVLKGWRSEMNRTAVLLIPNHTFKPNMRYTLVLGSLAGSALLSEGADTAYWDSGAGPDDSAPKWQRKPAVAEGQYLVEGGKLIRYIRLAMELDEQSPAYLVVTIQRATGSTAQQTYFVPVRDGQATLGHDACSGSFVFEDGRHYRTTVLGYDIAGNLAATVSPLEFQAPRPGKK